MRFVFRRRIIIFSIFLLLSGCISSQETNSSKNFKLTSGEDLIKLLLDNGGTYNAEDYGYGRYMDRYGNGFETYFRLEDESLYLSHRIVNIPDLQVLLPLKNYIKILGIFPDSSITDIVFLENFQQLKELYIGNQNVLSYEPLGKLANLNWLRIDNDAPVTIDCSIFANLENLEALMLSSDRIINLETIFDKSKEEFKLPELRFISLGEYTYSKKQYGSFLSKVAGLTPIDRSIREKRGNKDGEHYIDTYGNRFDGVFGEENKISVDILYTPYIDVLLRLKNNIMNLHIYENSPITDISFLKDFHELKKLRIINPNVLTLESMRYLGYIDSIYIMLTNPDTTAIKSIEHLSNQDSINHDSLSINLTISKKFLIENSYKGILEFLPSFKNPDRLNDLFLLDEDIKNEDEMYLLAKDIFKISGIQEITIGDNMFDRDFKKSFEFELGTYHILEYGANVRTEPNRNSEVIAVLNIHDKVEILENTFYEEKINNVWGYWYKIKYGNILGYTFGGNIAYEALAADIDKNGVKDYFYYRFSRDSGKNYYPFIEPDKDVIIYINDKRINTNVLSKTERYLGNERCFESCKLEEGDGYILIGLSQEGRHGYEYLHIFKVTPDGRIEFVTNWNEIDYW